MKKFIIGDIHGCYSELSTLIDLIPMCWGIDQLIFLGDYLDRGPDQHKVIEYIIQLKENWGSDTIIALRGNHEQMRLDSIFSGCCKNSNFKENTFLKSLPLYYEDEYCFYSHAGVNPLKPLDEQAENDLLWIREAFYNCSNNFPKTFIFGHTPTLFINNSIQPIVWENKIAIDTGCVFGGQLTALEMLDGKLLNVHSVPKLSA
ncbi:MAG: serine/threonine protein phosphatase [Clostridia bacterium]|nr:serine/threonine protein phosphatase [Clostridia bacterium]